MKKILIGLAILVLLVLGWVLQLLWASGAFKQLEPHFAGHCEEVGGVVGPEDITIPGAAPSTLTTSRTRARGS